VLAAAFGDEVVILDEHDDRLLWLDPLAARVWRLCGGACADVIARDVGETRDRIRETLEALLGAALVTRAGDGWVRAETEWV
jgi:DNA-binding transcriptional ArsR family regulator